MLYMWPAGTIFSDLANFFNYYSNYPNTNMRSRVNHKTVILHVCIILNRDYCPHTTSSVLLFNAILHTPHLITFLEIKQNALLR